MNVIWEGASKVLGVKGLEAFYGEVQALHGISLDIKEGEIVTLLGPNGAGKSTTLKSIMGLIKPSKGVINFFDDNITGKNSFDVVKKGISIVPEGRRIFPKLTVWENLQIGAYLRNKKKTIAEDLERVLTIFPQLKMRERQPGGTLSGGEQQMLAMGRALMSRPKLLLLDEPSMGLAPVICEDIYNVIQEINKSGTSILLVEQNAALASLVSQRGYVLETGRIAFEGTAAQLKDNDEIASAYFGET